MRSKTAKSSYMKSKSKKALRETKEKVGLSKLWLAGKASNKLRSKPNGSRTKLKLRKGTLNCKLPKSKITPGCELWIIVKCKQALTWEVKT